MTLYQHCFKCTICSKERPCFLIYVESDYSGHTQEFIETKIKKFSCGVNPNFIHQYSIPYEGEI